MANLFNKGDVVVLKSGGAPMTINAVPGDPKGVGLGERDTYHCVWHKGATPQQGPYPEHVLEKYVKPTK